MKRLQTFKYNAVSISRTRRKVRKAEAQMIFLDRNKNCVYIKENGENTMTKSFNVIIEKDEDGFFVATVPSLRGCHTQAKSLDKLMERTKEAIELCLEVEEDASENEFIGVQRLSVSV